MNSFEKLDPVELEKFLKGMDFPASKQDVINCALSNGAPDKVLQEIKNIPDIQFKSPMEISRQISTN